MIITKNMSCFYARRERLLYTSSFEAVSKGNIKLFISYVRLALPNAKYKVRVSTYDSYSIRKSTPEGG